MTVNDPYLSPSQGSDGSDASPPAEEAACGRGGSGGQRTERPSSASSSSFDSTGTTLQGTPTLDYEQESGWYVDSTGAAVHHNPTLTHNAETIETHDHRIARRDFVETPADNDERANLLNRLEQLPSNEIPDDLPMASPSPGHPQHNIRSTSHGTITYSPRRRRHTEHAATAVPAVHPAHRVSRFHKDLSDPELPDMSTITPHLTPPPPAPTGPPPDPINFASCEERNDWVAEQYRAFTTTITTELFGLENALRGLRALRDLGGEHARRTVQQAHLVREGLERLEES
ncbi:hypothetical protein B0A55_07818 [Friedmanniomyces simplex]|uniref:Uncharacterized protein n=1 Tax=Friedmanniomyces simplex TaxID=329884 RepID=A0A4U0X3N0_9PEZI|nr:hypothetical protein B0A55_07818 [Friedmanniomyces simplex]